MNIPSLFGAADPPKPFNTEDTWLVLLGVAVVVLAVLQFIFWRTRASSGAGAKDQPVFRDYLARYVLFSAIWGLLAVAIVVIVTAVWSAGNTKAIETAKTVFNSLLPVFGTWVGTLLAYYFSKENFEAASKSTQEFLKTAGASTGKLAELAAKDFMIPLEKIITLPADLQGKADKDILLSAIIAHLKAIKHDRLPLFVDNKGSGPAKCVVQLDRIKGYVADAALHNVSGQDVAKLTLGNLLTNGLVLPGAAPAVPLANADLALEFKGSFSLVKQTATLADAKAAMDGMTSAPGIPGNCYNIFVTETGHEGEPVIGWITNDIINDNAKV